MTSSSTGVVLHEGSCHCGAVKWTVRAPAVLNVFHCNCSVCMKKQNYHFIVASECFKLLQGADMLKTYTFNTGLAQHKFCKVCGVQSFYVPRSNPDSIGVAPHCIDSKTVEKVIPIPIDGSNWEETMKSQRPVPYHSPGQ